MKNTTASWGSTKINYVLMTDMEGVKWKVPTHIDGVPVEYLEKYTEQLDNGTFVKVTEHES